MSMRNHVLPRTNRPFRAWLKKLPARTSLDVMDPDECPLAQWLRTRVHADVKVRVGGFDYSLNGKDFRFSNWMHMEQVLLFDATRDGLGSHQTTAEKLRKHLETV